MDELLIRESVAEILGVLPEELTAEVELESFVTYDSTAQLSLMVCLSDLSGQQFELAILQKLRTFDDILALMKESSRNGQGS
jgi:acyl carrier protein